ncbi:DUF6058 family natural product biosynthesis protein [Vibrio coralliirubri]|nr:DUF6058 family natural product biosynthesis protein [Vibrio coralliirubri]
MLLDWQHFLQDTYGLCTSTELPDQIATKTFATDKVKTLTKRRLT